MFILILIIFLLPSALLPVGLKALFSAEELLEMGVYMEAAQPRQSSQKDLANGSQNSPLRTWASLPT